MNELGLVVEFFGAPGAGKTHLAQRLATCMRIRERCSVLVCSDVVSPVRYGKEWFRSGLGARLWMLRHPVYTARLFKRVSATGQGSFRECRRILMAWIKAQARIERFRKEHQLLLQDHGCFQLLWAIGYGAEPEQWGIMLPKFVRLIRPPDLMVIVNASQDTACDRLMNRRDLQGTTSRVQKEDLSNDQVRSRVAVLTEQIGDLVTRAAAEFGFKVVLINNDSDSCTATNVAQICEAICNCRSIQSKRPETESPWRTHATE